MAPLHADVQTHTQSPLPFWSAGGRQGRRWRIRKSSNVLIGCPITACIVSLQKSCGNKIPVPQSLSRHPPDDQKSRTLGMRLAYVLSHPTEEEYLFFLKTTMRQSEMCGMVYKYMYNTFTIK